MSGNEDTDPLVIGPIVPEHEEATTDIWFKVHALTEHVAAIEERTTQTAQQVETILRHLDGLARSIERAPDGRTLINLVGTILNKVEEL